MGSLSDFVEVLPVRLVGPPSRDRYGRAAICPVPCGRQRFLTGRVCAQTLEEQLQKLVFKILDYVITVIYCPPHGELAKLRCVPA
jgi:hypothetical protein